MCLFIETIRIYNGNICNLYYHQQRVDKTCNEVLSLNNPPILSKHIICPEEYTKGLIKCRVTYSNKIIKIEYEPYKWHLIKTLKVIKNNEISYNYKFADRSKINELFSLRGKCDDILIVKNNFITDTSFCNVLLWDGYKWVTPANPLLKGIMRQKAIQSAFAVEDEIPLSKLKYFKKICLINAMLDINQINEIDINIGVYF
ncbi:MAG TPA: aminotransferase class IV [Bacteroidales bacterium]|nr:aminotransferase class IV [Bacteroidales bacterium]